MRKCVFISWNIRRPSSDSPEWLQAHRRPRKVLAFGYKPNFCILQKSSIASCPSPFMARPIIMELNDITSLETIWSKTSFAWSKLPHLEYMSINAVARNVLDSRTPSRPSDFMYS
uniref:Uncharacterized protein n=1 Tax=Rhizophora mucronata TaxID=61149 RepID=A0A2P2PXX5_RHIMU